jgi:hypothetical protein
LFAIGGLGFYGGQGMLTVASTTETDVNNIATITTGEFSNPMQFGVYLYIDAIPFIDIEVDAQATWSEYTFDFSNTFGGPDGTTVGPYDSYWGGVSTYITLRKKLIGFGIPLLGGAKIHAGGGYNMHSFGPLANLNLVEDLMGDLSAEPEFNEKKLVEFVKDNKVDINGFHVQAGLQFNLLMLDSFLIYRQTFGGFEDVIDAKSFGSINLRLGFGI